MKLCHLVIALALFIVFASDSWGQSQQPSLRVETENSQNHPDSEKAPTAQPSAVTETKGPEQTKDKSKADKGERNSKPSETWSLSDKIAVIASFVALLQFLALIATVLVMRRTGERQLRAYVFIRPNHFRIDGDVISIRYEVRNVGQTPAHRVFHSSAIKPLPYPLPPDFVVESPTNFIGGFSLGSDDPIFGEGRITGSGDIRTLEHQNLRLYLIVVAKYIDAFKQERRTRLCAAVSNLFDVIRDSEVKTGAKPGDPIVGSGEIQFEYTNQHNDSD